MYCKNIPVLPRVTPCQMSNSALWKLKAFADDNFSVQQMVHFFSNPIKILLDREKILLSNIFSFSHDVFKRLLFQGPENPGLFGKRLNKLIIVWAIIMSTKICKNTISFFKCKENVAKRGNYLL